MKKSLIFLLAVLIAGCSSLPPQYSASPTRCLVHGVSAVEPSNNSFHYLMFGPSWTTHVLIHSVDGGDVLWVRPYHLGDKVWLEPGAHKLTVICSTDYSWGTMTRGTDIDLDVKPDCTYLLTASQIKNASDIPHVEVAEKASK